MTVWPHRRLCGVVPRVCVVQEHVQHGLGVIASTEHRLELDGQVWLLCDESIGRGYEPLTAPALVVEESVAISYDCISLA